jgi:sugar/nucleoside kinase (ribokinase family)
VIALIGNLSRDLRAGLPPLVGGGPYHAARALRRIETPARIVARCAAEDREALLPPVVRLGTPVQYVPGRATATFAFTYDGDRRQMRVEAVGDSWQPQDVPRLPDAVRWVHVAPLARSDFPAETLAEIGRRRRLLLDGQGLVRVPKVGPLELDGDFDPELLRHLAALKLSEEEAEVIGDPESLPVREVIVTHGSRGATLYYGGRVERIHTRRLPGDPTGAGDAFSISYVAARSTGLTPSAAAHRGTAVVRALLRSP